jgi:maltooligosyltrehalose trehalohydrolase
MAFDVWAPAADRVRLVLDGTEHDLARTADGWWAPSSTLEAAPGARYGYRLGDDAKVLPDPRSRRQPDGVHEASALFDPAAFEWTDQHWTGRQLAGSVIYELHIGTFTPEGTLDSAIERLDHLVDIGVDLVEVLPVNGFNGTHNWGYDGVLWYTVSESYGGPEAYQRFVDAAHERGLGVIQDVVYNHLGPSGNYLPLFGPYLTDAHANTWGLSVNLDADGSENVRRFILDNALMWLRDYHVDGLRLDAVHALVDESQKHLLQEMAEEVDALSAHVRRPLTLIAESDMNDPKLITPREGGGYGLHAQWSDDYHHAVHAALTGETTGYYEDFASLASLAKVVTDGFFHDGTYSSFRERDHGFPIDTENMPTWRLVVANQNHDQIGNRAIGDRLAETLDDGQLAIAAVLTLAGPFTPMLFMGEEFAASTPWQFFTSHPEHDLGVATAKGRIEEFAKMGWDENVVPDPQDPATFTRSKLDWSEAYPSEPAAGGRHTRLLGVYRALATLRRQIPSLTDPRFRAVDVRFDDDAKWFIMRRGEATIVINFATEPIALEVGAARLRFGTDDGVELTDATLTLGPHSAAILT